MEIIMGKLLNKKVAAALGYVKFSRDVLACKG